MDFIKFHVIYTITQKYAGRLLISVPVTNIKKKTNLEKELCAQTLPVVRSARLVYLH